MKTEGSSAPRSRIAWLLGTCLLVAVATGLTLLFLRPFTGKQAFFGTSFDPVNEAYDFELTDHNRQPLRLSQFHGKILIFAFGFTNCPSICPATLAHFSAIRRALAESDRDRVQFLFISVDPARDTPEKLKKYVPFFDPGFLGATGTDEALRKTAAAYYANFKIVREPGNAPDNYNVDHTSYAYLINPSGKWELLYAFDKLPQTDRIATDIHRVLAR